MSSWMNNLRNLGRPSTQGRSSPNQTASRSNASSPTSYSPSALTPPFVPPQLSSPSLSALTMADPNNQNVARKTVPFFFREEYTTFTVKGNFMTLAAKPQLVEEGEWISHQIVEQTRLLNGMVKCVQSEDRSSGRGLCNEQSCPTMSAGSVTYAWMDTNRNPINLPAATYTKHILTWVNGKIVDPELFPTATFTVAPPLPNPTQVVNDPNHWLGKTSGFPQRFESEIKNMYKQMFRCYAHLYWSHWLSFWDLNCYRELNTCFMHFVNVGRIFGLLTDKDTEPMKPLIDLWVLRGDLPKLKEADGEGNTAVAGSAPQATAAAPSQAPAAQAPPTEAAYSVAAS